MSSKQGNPILSRPSSDHPQLHLPSMLIIPWFHAGSHTSSTAASSISSMVMMRLCASAAIVCHSCLALYLAEDCKTGKELCGRTGRLDFSLPNTFGLGNDIQAHHACKCPLLVIEAQESITSQHECCGDVSDVISTGACAKCVRRTDPPTGFPMQVGG